MIFCKKKRETIEQETGRKMDFDHLSDDEADLIEEIFGRKAVSAFYDGDRVLQEYYEDILDELAENY